jgi:dTDP-L-rhamnose 4-epimerase
MEKILITGGAGFIGSALSLKLLEKGYPITVLDNLSRQIHGDDPSNTSPLYQSIKGKTNFILGSVTSKADWKKALQDQEIIIHLAAETGTGQSMYKIHHYVDVNSEGTAILLDILASHPHRVRKIILASSRAIYGEGKYKSLTHGIVYPKPRVPKYLDQGDFDVKYKEDHERLEALPTDEESKIHPSSVYGITKHNQEQLIMTVCPTLGISPVVFRYQNVYGPGQSLKNPYTGILSIFSTQIKNKNGINIFEDGKESRDFVYIDDVVNATLLGVEKEAADGEVFNVGSGVATDVLVVVSSLVKNYAADVPIMISGKYRLGDIRHNFADISKIKNMLGFTTLTTFEEGIKRFTDWVNGQDIETDQYGKSIKEMQLRGIFK